MPLIALKCPECGGDIQLDDAREFGFCMYCGCKVLLERAAPAGRPPNLRNILVLAYECIASEDWASAKPKVEQALMIDIDCPDAWFMKALVCSAAGDWEGERRAAERGRSLEGRSLGVMSYEDYARRACKRVTFTLECGFTRQGAEVMLEVDGMPAILRGGLTLKLTPGRHEVVAYDKAFDGSVRERASGAIDVDSDCSYVVRSDSKGLSVKRAARRIASILTFRRSRRPVRQAVCSPPRGGGAAEPPSAEGARFSRRTSTTVARRRRRPGGGHSGFLELWLSARHSGLTSIPPSGISQSSAPIRSAGTLAPPASSPA